ncbi:hypothetical protein EVAR_68520_1 [Eumeta japonica]|uniref:Cuticle protein 6 n=1 Tax=Eumeta variegata TaxID=151549 RepID=A0A4C1ZF58_EUMVA|nr:hypothetical protein EVAR_68520_1 [Eumeta japonica]
MITHYNTKSNHVLCALVCAGAASAARARPRLRQDDDALYYEPQGQGRAAGDQVVLVSADEYDALYRANDRLDESEYEPRGAARGRPAPAPPKESAKQPPVQTIRNYNKASTSTHFPRNVNDDGSFTFGYEAADGSFKEETRGTDCVVRGKYGYIDPDGNKREFTYVSGNPCDPNRPADDDEPDGPTADSDERDDPEPNYPAPRPAHRPAPAAPPRPPQPRPQPQPVALFQNDFRDADEEEADEEPPQPVRPRVVQRPALRRPAPAYRQQIAITPRPLTATTPRPLPPATTFRPQLLQLTASPQPQYSPEPTYSPSPAPIATTARPGQIDFAAEFAKFHRENQLQSTTSSNLGLGTKATGAPSASAAPTGNPLYSTELVYDPSSGQYDTQLYQTLPQTKGELNLNQRLQPFVAQPQQQPQLQPRPFVPSPQFSSAAKAPLYRQPIQRVNPQEVYQRQQQEAQFQNSAQLFAQQQQLQQNQLQRDRAAARAQAQRLALAQAQQAQAAHASAAPDTAPQYYYVAGRDGESPSSGQIDAFLRGHGARCRRVRAAARARRVHNALSLISCYIFEAKDYELPESRCSSPLMDTRNSRRVTRALLPLGYELGVSWSRSGAMKEGIGHWNCHSLDEMQQRQLYNTSRL